MLRKIERIENHVIVCGYGRFGTVARDLQRAGSEVVIGERVQLAALAERSQLNRTD